MSGAAVAERDGKPMDDRYAVTVAAGTLRSDSEETVGSRTAGLPTA
jgi:hypothetical protein